MLLVIFNLFAAVNLLCCEGWTDTKQRSFPSNFLFGVSASAYQTEGAWDIDGKSESIWDRFVHEKPGRVADGFNGDEACDSYHQWQRDVQMLRELGVDFYRFSISWSRVLPTGYDNVRNDKGLQYYDDLIDELLKYDIQPMITLYHFDLPQSLQELGGWTSPLIIQLFEDYARVIFERYSSKVKYWITVNQPKDICMDGYGGEMMAPGLNLKGHGDYLCVKHVLLAHARAYRLYEKEFKSKHGGFVGISIALNWYDPINNSTANQEAAEKAREFQIGLYMNPIWSKEGDFPFIVKDAVAKKSKDAGYSTSRLPKLTSEEIKLLKGSADFLGMNHYTTFLVKPATEESPTFGDDLDVEFSRGPDWKPAKSVWLKSAPYGIYKALIYLNQKYEYPTIIITEHGWSTDPGLRDDGRADNMRQYLGAVLLAMEDGAEVKGYSVWSLMDNVEWAAGTSERFGLYEVDFDSKLKNRTARLSALVYKHIIQARVVDDSWKPKNLKIAITEKKKKNTKGEL